MADPVVRVVDRADDGSWAVRTTKGYPPILTTLRRCDAIAAATEQLSTTERDGELRIYDGRGELERVERPSVDAPVAEPAVDGPPAATPEPVEPADEHGGATLGLAASLLAVALVPVVAAVLSAEAHGAPWPGGLAVVVATLTWSLTCAGTVVLVTRSSFTGTALLAVCLMALVLSWGFAALLGTSYLDLGTAAAGGTSPSELVLGSTVVAMQTLGVVGAFVGAAVGVWLGIRVAPLIDEL